MTYAIGRGVRIEIGTTEGSAKAVTAVSAAKPPVASSVAHGLTAKSVGYFSTLANAPQLVGQACRLAAVTANDFTLEDLDMTGNGAAGAGSFIPVTAWATLASTVDYQISEAAADKLDVSVLLDDQKQEENGQLAAQTVSFNVRTETVGSAAMQRVRETARKGDYLVFRISFKDGSVRVFRGQPSLPGESVAQGAVGSGSFSVTIKGFVIEGAA
ncbi:phage tail tube protein [Aquabacterium sp. A7-Y]|uniref:phage tail tube protein n=1 Tax=Aquabacterium sp. A7-Y TaxID=1349605 RepID=UPI00223D5ED7|nr:phage tail tube protein [Aquabacterium sp. A7-Y]MCW7542017.1 phage tail tube protein [Aquabacterium sp. A7-Y]